VNWLPWLRSRYGQILCAACLRLVFGYAIQRLDAHAAHQRAHVLATDHMLSRLRMRINMRAVHHFLPLSKPALPSAPDKKSFSSANCPIFACSAFRSTGGSLAG
jgi:hypothetical protein